MSTSHAKEPGSLTPAAGFAAAAVVMSPLLVAQVLPFWIQGLGEVAAAAAALVVAGVLLGLARRHVGADSFRVIAVLTVAVLGFIPGVLVAQSPLLSLTGSVGAPYGVASWLVALAAFMCGALLPWPRGGIVLARALAACGVLAALAAGAERVGLVPTDNLFSSELTGLLGDSAILAQVLIVAFAAALAWWRGAIGPLERYVSGGVALVCATGLLVSGSRTGIAVLVLIVALAAAHVAGRVGTALLMRILGAILLAAMLSVFVFAWPGLPADARVAADETLNYRSSLWHAAWVRVSAAPLVGTGPGSFSALTRWQEVEGSGLGIDPRGSFSPHSLPLEIAVGGGAVAVIPFAAFVVLFARALRRGVVSDSADDAAAPMLLLGLSGWGLLALTQLSHPLTLVTGALVGGALLSWSNGSQQTREIKLPPPGGMVALAGVIALALMWMPLAIARQTAAAATDPSRASSAVREAWERTGDPAYGHTLLLEAVERVGRDDLTARDEVTRLATAMEPLASWHYLTAVEVARAWAALGDAGGAEGFERAVAAGRSADPRSGLWPYMEARRAHATGDGARAQEAAREALAAVDLPASARDRMKSILGEQAER